MSSRRILQPASGGIACLGAGLAIVVLGDEKSEARQYMSSRASEIRREVLLRALSKRLLSSQHGDHPEAQQQQRPAQRVSSSSTQQPATIHASTKSSATVREEFNGRFYVVTGPDADLTSLARERLSHVLLSRRDEALASPRPARLIVPYDCLVGTGRFSSLMEEQLLEVGASLPDSGGNGFREDEHESQEQQQQQQLGRESYSSDWQPEEQQEQEDHQEQQRLDGWNSAVDENKRGEEALLTPSPIATVPYTGAGRTMVSRWESLQLRATLALMNGEQLDSAALWALERALSSPHVGQSHATASGSETLPSSASGPRSVAPLFDNMDEATEQARGVPGQGVGPALADAESEVEAESTPIRSSFVLEIASPARDEDPGAGGREVQDGHGGVSPTLCHELVRWGWGVAAHDLGHVIVSSPNPWILAAVQRALQNEGDERSTSPQGSSSGDGDGGAIETAQKAPLEMQGEVVVVRVALPSAAEREQAVLSVAEELEVDYRLSALDISMLAELTGGRRVGLLDALKRVKGSSTATVTVTEACQTAVDDQARSLARTWALLSRDSLDESEDDEVGGASDANRPGAVASTTPVTPGFSNSTGGGATDGGRGREEWATLWEALEVLSEPSVAVNAAPTSAPPPPQGSMPAAELLEECAVDSETLLQLTGGGWLEISPAGPSASGTVLEDPEFYSGDSSPPSPPPSGPALRRRRHRRPPVTVHPASVPVDSLARLDRSYLGAPPFRLAAFRRMLDFSSARPTQVEGLAGVDAAPRGGDSRRATVGVDGEGTVAEVAVEAAAAMSGSGADPEEGEIDRVQGLGSVAARRDRDLERAGCLIKASVLGRMRRRGEDKLLDDGEILCSNWAELGAARQDLERSGRGDASEGEWAEVQLELIRQERAVVASASEMRARRARLEELQRDILTLERRANSRSPSIPQAPMLSPIEFPREFSRDAGQPPREDSSPATMARAWEERRRRVSAASAEEAVIEDAERGVRLMPLRGQSDGERRESAGRGVDGDGRRNIVSTTGEEVGGRTDRQGGYGRRLWRWMVRGGS